MCAERGAAALTLAQLILLHGRRKRGSTEVGSKFRVIPIGGVLLMPLHFNTAPSPHT